MKILFFVLYCMKMFDVQSPHHDMSLIKRKCKFLHNVMSLANLLCEICEICKDFAEKELRGYSCSDCA